ncbi:glyoxalase [Rhodoferax sp. TH121]|uniref:VOC family protein n=1 Tax=Rhodoferax sp. TH121 TaxID=2022803 RepID=UPI000B976541|nr:VOC family protein [Rhodoferax sp. TH121]OYQ41328.1 glyoxalase [Rhodoferax sp. TH121]
MANALNWFEIPVSDFGRAQAFYETILGTKMERMDMGPTVMGMIPADQASVGGAIVFDGTSQPSANGTVVYLNGGADLAPILGRVEAAGGRILVPKTEIGNDFGFFAHFLDSEGNKVGLHSMA